MAGSIHRRCYPHIRQAIRRIMRRAA